jgi:ABC-2 type transport system ATP-binding protein
MMIHTEKLSKQFSKGRGQTAVNAVDDLSIDIAEGEVFGFLGPNGAGKTTTVRMLTSLIAPTSGAAVINGMQIGKQDTQIRQIVGILTETPGMYDRLSAHKNLSIFARLYGVKDVNGQVEKFLRLLGLWDRRLDEVGGFSKGMRQKLAIARSLLHQPKVLFLDEPTSGLDPEAAHLVRDFIEELKSEGTTIFLCTHNLDEADRLCQRIAIFKSHLITVDTPQGLRLKLFGRKVVFHLRLLNPQWVKDLAAIPGIRDVQPVENRLVVSIENPETQNPAIIRRLVELGADIQFVGELRHTLEDIYLEMIHS